MNGLDNGSWLFPEFFKLAVSKDKDVGPGMRVYSVMVGTGLLVIEPVFKVCDKLGIMD
jgi:hypothetical protein